MTTFFTWHLIFWINIPIGVIGVILVTLYLPADTGRTERPLDRFGLALSGITFAGIMFGISVVSLPAIPLVAGYAAIAVGIVTGLLYLAHARRTEFPILDPRMFRRPVFRAAILSGSLFRIGVGAFPFLMPLMLQLTFGLNPFESGLITFVAAIGALISKFGAERLYFRFGFPRTLMATAAIGTLLLAINSLFTPDTPHWTLMAALALGGLARSFFFTGLNALVFSDVDEQRASQATAINAVAQQLSVAAGVAVAGTTLELVSQSHGGGLTLGDFHVAWLVVAGISLASALPLLRLPPNTGHDLTTDRRAKPITKPVDPAL